MDLITSIFNILASQAFGTLMQNLTKAVLFVMSLPLIYFVATQPLGDRKTSASERNSLSQPRLGERSAPYICRHMYIYAEQEREREKFASQTRNGREKFARQCRNGSEKLSTESGYRVRKIGMQQALWMGAEGSLACSKQRKFESWVIQVKAFRIATRTRHMYFEQRLEAQIQMHLCWLRGIVMLCLQLFAGSF